MDRLSFEDYLSAWAREQIEQRYYSRVSEQAKMEILIHDPSFLVEAAKHPAFYSDHGVVHVRDVAGQILHVLQIINGVLIPRRSLEQMESFLYGYGVVLAYLHDIGMSDLSPFGRAIHPEFAAQSVFDDPLSDVVTAMWDDNSGNVRSHLTQLFNRGVLRRDPQIVFRELLAMSIGHSKSKIPATMLDDPAALRKQMQETISHHLHYLFARQMKARGKSPPTEFSYDDEPPVYLERYYSNFDCEAFDWLTPSGESKAARQLVQDVTDTLRALRCADAFRQRGTVEKTSGGYEIYISQKTGESAIALRLGGDRLFLMELPNNPDGAGEANIASSEFNREGNIRISFHRGAFENQQAQVRSAYSTAYVISDFLRDTVDSFWRQTPIPSVKTAREILILLESTDDNPHFAELVAEQLCQFNPQVTGQIQIVPSLRNVSDLERDRYLRAEELNWDAEKHQAVLDRIHLAGQKIAHFNPQQGFKHVRFTQLQPGEKLIESGAPANFVYIPLGDGLKIIPLGGYQSFAVAAWMPLGTTGVIRGDIRNADILAERVVEVLMIPKETYLRYWYSPYSPAELKRILAREMD